MSAHDDVEAAAITLIEAFARNDRAAYFAAFTPDATFIFHATNRVLDPRSAYEAEWDSWIREFDFHVQDCVSFNRVVKIFGDVAVFTHQTITHSTISGTPQTLHERETIVFHKQGDQWLAVHEHLSPLPAE